MNSKKISLRGPVSRQRRLTADSEESAFLDSFGGAVVSASATADTNISIDDELVFTLGNSLDGAVVSASAALDTSISDIVSHEFPSNICFCAYANNATHLYSSMDF